MKAYKLIALLLFVTLLLGACLPVPAVQQPQPAAQGQTAEQPAPAPQAEPPIKVTWMNVAWGTPPATQDTPVQKLIEEETNVDLEMIWVPWNEIKNRVNVGMATGDLADVTQVAPDGPQIYTSQQVKAIQDGVFADLTPYLTGPDFAKNYPNLAKIPAEIWKNITFNGKIYGIPRHLAPYTFDGIFIRKDLFIQAGYKYPEDVPTTMDELTEVILKLSNPPSVYGLGLSGDDLDGVQSNILAVAFTGVQNWSVDQEGNFTYRAFMPEYKDFLKWVKMLYEAGAINPEFPLGQNSEDYNNGKAAVTLHRWHAYIPTASGAAAGGFNDETKAAGADTFETLPLQGPKCRTVEMNPGYWTQSMISAKVPAENIPRILRLIDFMAADEFNELAYFGIEGIHYEVKDGKKVTNDRYNEDAVRIWSGISHINNGWQTEYWRKWLADQGASPENQQMAKDAGDGAIAALKECPSVGIPHYTLYSETLATRWDELTAKLRENRVKFIVGRITEQEWDEYVQSITSSETYQQILQELKDAYLAQA